MNHDSLQLVGMLDINTFDVGKRVYSPDGLCATITSCGGGYQGVRILDKSKVRKITPREAWRLMGFSDEDFDKARPLNSDSQLYRQAGNSIVVPVLEGILKNLLGENNDKV